MIPTFIRFRGDIINLHEILLCYHEESQDKTYVTLKRETAWHTFDGDVRDEIGKLIEDAKCKPVEDHSEFKTAFVEAVSKNLKEVEDRVEEFEDLRFAHMSKLSDVSNDVAELEDWRDEMRTSTTLACKRAATLRTQVDELTHQSAFRKQDIAELANRIKGLESCNRHRPPTVELDQSAETKSFDEVIENKIAEFQDGDPVHYGDSIGEYLYTRDDGMYIYSKPK